MGKDTSEIAKLTERISKDPKSKLFVPLAEEYKKNGDIEMAIHVLSEGLKNNPGYVTARSFLGRLLFEKGELAASQSEFEEVVKAIPDNLLAQRKLGDLNILQNRRDEALKHYKIALALNPGDAEVASLISDIEDGIDVRAGLQSKSKTSPEQAAPPSSQQSTTLAGTVPLRAESPAPKKLEMPAAALPASVGASEPLPASVSEREPEQLPEPPSMMAETTKPAESIAGEPGSGEETGAEEPEEVLVVEPLEDGGPPEEVLLTENAPLKLETEPEFIEREETEKAFMPSETVLEEPLIFPEEKTMQASGAEQAAPITEEPAVEPTTAEKSSEQLEADDFTTDTLAELYIAQGFFEKAIDIYERMLADNPTSRGLKDKLVRVKAMAGPLLEEQAPLASEEKTKEAGKIAGQNIFAEAKEYTSPPAGEEQEVTLDADLYFEPDVIEKNEPRAQKSEADIFAEPREYQPPPASQEWPGAASEGGAVDEIFMPPQEVAREKPRYVDFEPREYIPPAAETKPTTRDEMPEQKVTPAARKKTIDRLETWLSNIKKEK
jgi:tetratricopeptide (TPR) repeat protein